MKIAIHNSHTGFHPHWVTYCEQKQIPFKRVNCYASNLIEQLHDCDALMWHHFQMSPRDLVVAKSVLFALQQAGVVVFPDFNTGWHFDDKLGQKYLLEALGLPLVHVEVFYNKKEAVKWAGQAVFPKVLKLRGGASSANVRLVRDKKEARRLIEKAFGRGFRYYDAVSSLKERWRKWRQGKSAIFNVLKGLVRIAYPPPYQKVAGKEVGYIYFQDFVPNNDHDVRVIVIGDKAFAIKRLVRDNDFRASGSGTILYEKENFENTTIQLAFDIHESLKSQCTAMDFVFLNHQPKVVEISYGFSPEGYISCPGYWDKNMIWHEGPFDPYGWMVELILNAKR